MGGGNGAKSQQKRERNAAKDGKGSAKSQLKVNQKAMNIQCDTCKATFLSTTREPTLKEHALNKHNKTIAECFLGWQPPAA